MAVSYSHSSHPDSSLHLSLRVWKKVIKGRNPILHACRPFLLPAFLPAFQRTVVKFTRDEVKQFPFTTTRLPRYSFVCYFLFPFAAVSFHFFFPPFSFPLLYSGSRSLSNFTLHSAPPSVSSLFRQRLPVFSFFFSPLFFFFFFLPPRRLYNPLTPRTRRSLLFFRLGSFLPRYRRGLF